MTHTHAHTQCCSATHVDVIGMLRVCMCVKFLWNLKTSQRRCPSIVCVCVCVCVCICGCIFNLAPLVHIQSIFFFYLVTNEAPISVQRKGIFFQVSLQLWGLFISIIMKSARKKKKKKRHSLCWNIYGISASDAIIFRCRTRGQVTTSPAPPTLCGLIDCEMTSLVVMW